MTLAVMEATISADPVGAANDRGRALVEAARRGDRAAFGRLYEQFAPLVHGILIAHVPGAAVDDLVQDAFVTAMRRLGTLRDAGAFGPWIARIARNLARDHYRTASRRPRAAAEPVELDRLESPRSSPEAEGLAILAVLSRLPRAYRETLALRLVEGMTGPEIAAATGLTHGSVRVNLHRGMALLRKELTR